MNLLRRAILRIERERYLDCLPDKQYLQLIFFARMGKRLRLQKPQTFSEKLQWLKLYDRKPEYTTMVDKYEAKQYVAKIIGQEHIVPTLGVWDSFEQIDFDSLPDQFVLKTTHDSGGLSICRDKATWNRAAAKEKIERSLKQNYYTCGREWPYKDAKPRIIAESYMQDPGQPDGLRDNKFYCFNGEPKFLYVSEGLEDHNTAKISFLNMDWTFAPFRRSDYRPFTELPPKPAHYEQMLTIARQLSRNIPFVRVDLYEIGGQVYFSELTFSPCSGMMPIAPEQWDKAVGDMLTLPESGK